MRRTLPLAQTDFYLTKIGDDLFPNSVTISSLSLTAPSGEPFSGSFPNPKWAHYSCSFTGFISWC
jgi:hypothetical protein